jgi:nitrogen-specific signal transduction histidine kinase
MQGFADFAAIAVRHRRQQQRLFDQATASATAAIANELAHRINNPLQSITNLLYLVLNGGDNIPDYARQATSDLERVSALVRELLTISQPVPPHKS